jgi:hypothetical protein
MWVQDRVLTVLHYEYRDATLSVMSLRRKIGVPSLRSTSKDGIEEEREFVPL